MLKYLIISICFILSLPCAAAAASTNLERFNDGMRLFKSRDYKQAFTIFSELCGRRDFAPACLMVAQCRQAGLGVEKKSAEALEIYKKYASLPPVSQLQDLAKFQLARMLEYDFGGQPGNLHEAAEIYRYLRKRGFIEKQKEIDAAIARLDEYQFIRDVFPALFKFNSGRINYDELKISLDAANLKLLPAETARKFEQLRMDFLAYAKDAGDNALDKKQAAKNPQYRQALKSLEAMLARFSDDKISENWFLTFSKRQNSSNEK